MEVVDDTIFHDETVNESSSVDPSSEEHAWVQWYQRSWLEVEESADGRLVNTAVVADQADGRRYVSTRAVHGPPGTAIKKGLIRFLYIIIDYSEAMQQSDYKPNRTDFVIAGLCNNFLPNFFQANPLSYVSIIVMRNGSAHFVTKMNGQPVFQIKKLKEFAVSNNPSGTCSLVAAIDLVLKSSEAPQYATKEMLIIWGSLSSMDPPNTPLYPFMTDKIRTSPNKPVIVNIVSLSPEVFAVKKITESVTSGAFKVAMNGADFMSQLHALLTPIGSAAAKPVYIKMGFPIKSFDAVKLIKCVCHRELHNTVFCCPQCQSFVCEIPVACPVCKLTLCEKDMLTRVHRLLYEMPEFRPVAGSGKCFGCDTGNGHMYTCSGCQEIFCADCDVFLHDGLRHCMGCLTKLD